MASSDRLDAAEVGVGGKMDRVALVASFAEIIIRQGLLEDVLEELDQRVMVDAHGWREEVRQALREELTAHAKTVTAADGLMTVEEAAEYAGVKPPTIRAWIREHKLVASRAGRQWRVRREDLDKHMAVGKEESVNMGKLAANIVAMDRRRVRR